MDIPAQPSERVVDGPDGVELARAYDRLCATVRELIEVDRELTAFLREVRDSKKAPPPEGDGAVPSHENRVGEAT